MKRGLTDIINVMRGSTQVTKVMRGTVLIWEKAVGGYDADYQAVLDYATANAIVLPTGVQQDIDNQLMIDYKATGAWNKNDSVFKFEGTADPAFKLIDWKRLILGATFGSVTWDVDGIKGNGTNAYFNPHFNPSLHGVNYTTTNASIMFTQTALGLGDRAIFGMYEGDSNTYCLSFPNDGVGSYIIVNGIVNNSQSVRHDYLGLTSINRLTATSANVNTNTPATTTQETSSYNGLPQSEIYIMARNYNGTPDLFWDGKLGFVSFGSDKTEIHNSIKTVLE